MTSKRVVAALCELPGAHRKWTDSDQLAAATFIAAISGDYIEHALPHGSSPAKPEEVRARFKPFFDDRCKGKEASKLRFVVE